MGTNTLVLPNCDLDSGQATKAAEYSLTDDTYAKLLAQLSNRKFDLTSPELRDNILQFYADLSAPIETKKDPARWQSVLTALDQLKSSPHANDGEQPCTVISRTVTRLQGNAAREFAFAIRKRTNARALLPAALSHCLVLRDSLRGDLERSGSLPTRLRSAGILGNGSLSFSASVLEQAEQSAYH